MWKKGRPSYSRLGGGGSEAEENIACGREEESIVDGEEGRGKGVSVSEGEADEDFIVT